MLRVRVFRFGVEYLVSCVYYVYLRLTCACMPCALFFVMFCFFLGFCNMVVGVMCCDFCVVSFCWW